MLNKIVLCWNILFAPRDWTAFGDLNGSWSMRRWRNGKWETREANNDEQINAAYWQANR